MPTFDQLKDPVYRATFDKAFPGLVDALRMENAKYFVKSESDTTPPNSNSDIHTPEPLPLSEHP